ncbi:hypothetical protein [Pantoea sp.]|uniref:hypothetical protein n=1 Tax=Pantoea sp. TaxID=69393 RepID=UPI00289D8579|nr:hypothetical protein [Pantoea sp.]
MKIKIEIIDAWPVEAIEKGGFNHVNYHDSSLTPSEKKLFVIENEVIYEHTILAPVLSDIPDNSLVEVKVQDENSFIVEVLDSWPEHIDLAKDFITRERFNKLEFGYLTMLDGNDVLPSHIEFKALIPYYKSHLEKNNSWPLVRIFMAH